MADKNTLRAQALAARDALSAEFGIEAALMIASFAQELNCAPGQIISGFWPIRSEIDVRPLMFALMQQRCQLCLPRVTDPQTIQFRQFNRADPLIKAGFGTMGPADDAPIVDPEIMLMPLAAFDLQGNRIGYGAGHYDRAIAKLHAKGLRPRLIGVAFSCQRVDTVPAEAHDVPLEAIVTENGLHAFNAD